MKTFAGILTILMAALLWPDAARADLDDIRRAAESGDSRAQLELGILFDYGSGYKGNEIPALTWYTLSADRGNARAVTLRDALKARMSEKEVQEAMEQVAQFKPSGKSLAAPPAPPAPPEEIPATEPVSATPPAAAPLPPQEAPAAETTTPAAAPAAN